MDINVIKKQIDTEIASKKSDKFGIKVGGELYRGLAKTGSIKKITFSAFGTGAFPEKLPAYNGKYFIFHDWELGDYDFAVGNPNC